VANFALMLFSETCMSQVDAALTAYLPDLSRLLSVEVGNIAGVAGLDSTIHVLLCYVTKIWME
jgi:hypothetical protein